MINPNLQHFVRIFIFAFQNTYCFLSKARIHLSKDYNIFFKETINRGTYSGVSRQWLRRNKYEAVMAVKEVSILVKVHLGRSLQKLLNKRTRG